MTRASLLLSVAAALLAGLPATPARACWDQVAQKYGVDAYLLHAIAKTESSLDPSVLGPRNSDGSYDVGLMQINSSWFPRLARLGIREKDLYEPCISIEVGAWILANNIRHYGNTWAAVAAYNTPDPAHGLKYARRVYMNLPPQLRGAPP